MPRPLALTETKRWPLLDTDSSLLKHSVGKSPESPARNVFVCEQKHSCPYVAGRDVKRNGKMSATSGLIV
jgi:hypothetical protein